MPNEKKLIIDEDWKAQVEAERKAAQTQQESPADPTGAGAADDVGDVPMPPASFDLLLTTLATEALVALGQIPHPATGEALVRRHQAKYLIDMIDVLRQKTKGNLSTSEQQTLDGLLHQLRMAFLESST
jgi:hypothetical protein